MKRLFLLALTGISMGVHASANEKQKVKPGSIYFQWDRDFEIPKALLSIEYYFVAVPACDLAQAEENIQIGIPPESILLKKLGPYKVIAHTNWILPDARGKIYPGEKFSVTRIKKPEEIDSKTYLLLRPHMATLEAYGPWKIITWRPESTIPTLSCSASSKLRAGWGTARTREKTLSEIRRAAKKERRGTFFKKGA